jgi:tetratricopeptide (TPR) repeat protein
MNTNPPVATVESAMAAVRAGDFPRALAFAEALLSRKPNDPNALQIVGLIRGREGKTAEALDAFLKADRAAPNQAPILNSIGALARERGDLQTSRAALERAVTLSPAMLEARMNFAVTLAAMGRRAEADSSFRKALEIGPKSAEAHGRYARFLEETHELDRARTVAERALGLDPKNAVAILTLIDLDGRVGAHDRALLRAEAASSMNIGGAVNRAMLLGGAARALEKLGRHSEAFAKFAEANATLMAHYAPAYANVVGPRSPTTLARLESFASATNYASWTQHEDLAGEDPVFFLGFPRSGTTLLDQVLSSAEGVTVLEEKENIADAWLELVLAPGGLDRWASLSREDVLRFREAYWTRARAHLPAKARLVIDKLPLDTALLGLIHRLFPNAKIIFALRDPRDCVLSAFQQTFGMNAAMFQFLDLETAARYYDQVMRLGALWREKLPLRLHAVRYESVVADFETEIRALLAFLDLPWTDSIRNFHETAKRRTIRTPSARQVVQPLYAASVAKWRRYEAELAPIRPLLDPWAKRFGYDE